MARAKAVDAEPNLPPIVTPILDALEAAGLARDVAVGQVQALIQRWGVGTPEFEKFVTDLLNNTLQIASVERKARALLVSELIALAQTGKSDVPPSDPANLA